MVNRVCLGGKWVTVRNALLTISWMLMAVAWPGSKLAVGQSLWDKRVPEKSFLFNDLKPRRVGDLLTIVISENTDVANADSRAMQKSATMGAGTDFSYSGSGGSGSFNGDINADSNRNFNGGSSFSSAREFSDRFSVMVIDVLPNGNLLVSGNRTVLVEGDLRELTLSGVIRGYDIQADNTVLSQRVADLNISFAGKGPESSYSKQGWLGKRINRLWPF